MDLSFWEIPIREGEPDLSALRISSERSGLYHALTPGLVYTSVEAICAKVTGGYFIGRSWSAEDHLE